MDYNKIDDRIQDVDKIQKEAIKKVQAYARPKTFFAVVELILCSILSMGIKFVEVGLDFSKFMDPNFYIGAACTLAGILLVFRATINAVYYKTSQRQVVLDAKEAYKEANSKKDLDLKIFLNIYNKDRKIELYIMRVNKKIFKLERRLMKTLKPKKIEKYNQAIDNLKEQITSEYIVAHIDRIPIKQELVFYSDFNELDNPVSSEIKTRADYNGTLNKETLSKIGWYVVTTLLLGIGVSTGTDKNWISFTVSLFATALMTGWRIFSALKRADYIYDSTITKSLIDRTEILKEYFVWQKENPDAKIKEMEEEIKKIRESVKAEYDTKLKAAVTDGIKKYIEETRDKPVA